MASTANKELTSGVTDCIFVTDLHGNTERYRKLLRLLAHETPHAVFLGGDLLPSGVAALSADGRFPGDFVNDFLVVQFEELRSRLGERYPKIFIILGNDDRRSAEPAFAKADAGGLWSYLHGRRRELGEHPVYGYAYVPPTPFLLKDWERYDVSRYVDPGCVSPEEGHRSVPVPEHETKYATIQNDLAALVGMDNLTQAVFLFHTPPHRTNLDRVALDGKAIEHVPLDVHVGSIAVRRFIERHQPLVTLHGHVHESARLTGSWRDTIGRTHLFSAAHDGPELSLVCFDLENPATATRELR